MSTTAVFDVSEAESPEVEQANAEKVLSEGRAFAGKETLEHLKNGEWFLDLLKRVTRTYDVHGRARYFQQKYAGLPADEVASHLVSVAARYAALVGAVAGASATIDLAALLASAGLTASLYAGTIGAEMIGVTTIQFRLVLDLATIYDAHIDPDDPEDVLIIFGYALGIAPNKLMGDLAVQMAAGWAGKRALARAVQKAARVLGLRLLQRTIIKYSVPVASAVAGSSYNFVSTKALATIATVHFKNRGRMSAELEAILSRERTYETAFPAAIMYMAEVDGRASPAELELYRGALSRLHVEEHAPEDFKHLLKYENALLDQIAEIEDAEVRVRLIEVLGLMAAYDGELAQKEREFLSKAAERLNAPLDWPSIEHLAAEYHQAVNKSFIREAAVRAGEAAAEVAGRVGVAGNQAQHGVETAAHDARQRISRLLHR